MKVIVTGASGLLGRAIYQRLKEDGYTVVGTAFSRATPSNGLTRVDLTDSKALTSFLQEQKAHVIVHTAAERRPDVVEKSPEASHKINVDVPTTLAQWCAAARSDGSAPLLINISTDYVFDGRSPPYAVDDRPNPLNAYGKSKLEGEQGVRQHGIQGRVTNVRVPVLYGKVESNDESAVNILLDAVLGDGGSKKKKMDANATRYPTNVEDVAKVVSQLCTKFGRSKSDNAAVPSILHFSASEAMTKYDMSLTMARCLRAAGKEAHTDHLVPEREVDPNAATSRPQNCQLDVSVLRDLGIDVSCVPFEQVSFISIRKCFLIRPGLILRHHPDSGGRHTFHSPTVVSSGSSDMN